MPAGPSPRTRCCGELRRARALRAGRRDRRRDVDRLRCGIVCGAANNQLADDAPGGAARRAGDPLRARLHRQRRRADARLQGDPGLRRGARATSSRSGSRRRSAASSSRRAATGRRRSRGARARRRAARARGRRRARCDTERHARALGRPRRPGPLRGGAARPEAARGGAPRRRDPRRAAAARAPAGLHQGPALDARTSCRWARTGTGCRGSRSPRPTAAAASPTTGPGQLVGYPIVDLGGRTATTSTSTSGAWSGR